jgi:hypothetical protein
MISQFEIGYHADVSWDFGISSPLSELANGAPFPNLQDEVNRIGQRPSAYNYM